MPMPKKRRLVEDKFAGDSDHHSDGESGVQPMMTKIKTVLKSEPSSHKRCCDSKMLDCITLKCQSDSSPKLCDGSF